MNKRGQVTLLVVLGILLVSSVVLVYYYRDRIFLSEWERERAESLLVPEEVQELHDSVSSCVEDLAGQAVTLLGQQGGYITLPEDPLGDGAYNPFSNALEIFPGSQLQTAYWFYQAANGVDHSQVPSKELMEAELAAYMDANLASCSSNFELFTAYNATAGDVSSTVQILDSQVLFTIHYPIHIALDDFLFDFDSFYVSKDVPLGSMYDAAVQIMDAENSQYPLEDLSYDSLVLNDEEVPLSWAEFDCTRKHWDVHEVQQHMQSLFSQNILALKVRGTGYGLSSAGDTDYFEWNLLETPSENLHVTFFNSESWPFSMQVYPTEGSAMVEDTLTGNSALSALRGLFCLNSYNFIYDIKYPVLISLYDDRTDYRFQFASMVVLDNNQARKNTEGLLDLTPVETPLCDNAVTPLQIDTEEAQADGSLVPLDGVSVSFQCINARCPLGSTHVGGENTFLVPQCVNGQVIAEKDGYQEGVEVVTSLEETSASVILEPYYNLSYSLKVVDLDGNVRDPASDETLFVTLTEEESGYSTTVSYPPEGDTLLLVPGTYTVDGHLVSDVPFDISIDPSQYTKCVAVPQLSLGGLFGLDQDTSCTDVSLDAESFQSSLTGGVSLHWVLDRDALVSAQHVTLYVTSPGRPGNTEEAKEVYTYLDTGLGLREPELS